MANLKSSKKDIRKTARRRAYNLSNISLMRTLYKKILKLAIEGNTTEAKQVFRKYGQHLDRISRKNIIHIKQAARRKRRAIKLIKKVS